MSSIPSSKPAADSTVGDVVAAFLERCGVSAAYGVISIHNMPILDAFLRRGRKIDFVTARGEQGALNMADAHARVSGGLGVGITSTGTAAGNACGSLVEAMTAGTPVLHLTGQIEVAHLDRDLGYIHEAPDQLTLLSGACKRAFRVWRPEDALPVLKEAVQLAMTAPRGPVSVEIPIDVQGAAIAMPADLEPLPVTVTVPEASDLDRLAERIAAARRPLLWLGGGARHTRAAVERLAALGMGIVTSVQGRGILPEDHPASLGSYNLQKPAEDLYKSCDAMLVAGSRIRSNETLTWKLALPRPLYRIDADPAQANGRYPIELFVQGDAALALEGLASRLEARGWRADPKLHADVAVAKAAAHKVVLAALGPYEKLVEALQQALAGRDFVFVRDITLSNSMWGNRTPALRGPRDGVHALGGGIGQGIQMALGAAKAAGGRKVVCLSGDGGLQVNLGELATIVEQRADITLILMNDGGYGVIRNIQDAMYGGRHGYTDLHTPDFALLAKSIALPHARVGDTAAIPQALAAALAAKGPFMVEIDMKAIGPFAQAFAGPPVRKTEKSH